MSVTENVANSLNLPKQLLDKSEALLKTLFGASMGEVGGLLADQVRLRRFKNQISIFNKAQQLLKEHHIDPQRVSLKVLAPLIEYTSYEEDESLQDKWARLTAFILGGDEDTLFQQNSIAILSKLSATEANLMEQLYQELQQMRQERHAQQMQAYASSKQQLADQNAVKVTLPEQYAIGSFYFSTLSYPKEHHTDQRSFYNHITNLIALGLLKWETQVEVKVVSIQVKQNRAEVETHVQNDRRFSMTTIGERLVRICKPA